MPSTMCAAAELSAVFRNTVLLSGQSPALNIDLQAFQHHPVRMTIGVISLVLAIILTIYTLTKARVNRAKRNKSYGSGGKMTGTSVPSYK